MHAKDGRTRMRCGRLDVKKANKKKRGWSKLRSLEIFYWLVALSLRRRIRFQRRKKARKKSNFGNPQ
jgi:hypothetical protein